MEDWTWVLRIVAAAYFIFAVSWSAFEQFIFDDRQFHVGASNFLKVNGSFRLVRGYHGPMAIFFALIPICSDAIVLILTGRFAGFVFLFPSALWIEDMGYYVNNPFDKPDGSENITGALGFWGKVPRLWICGFVYTALIIWWRFF